MDKDIVMEKLQLVFQDVFADDSIVLNESTSAKDIEGWDSLMHISILAAVQDEFSVDFDMEEIIAMKTVGDIARLIYRKLNM